MPDRRVLVLSVLLLVLLPVAVRADQPECPAALAVQEHIRRGNAMRLRGDVAPALREFQCAYSKDPSPRNRAQLGLAEKAAGRLEAAAEHLSQCLAATGDPFIEQHRAVLNSMLVAVQQEQSRRRPVEQPPQAPAAAAGRPLWKVLGFVAVGLGAVGLASGAVLMSLRDQEATRFNEMGCLSQEGCPALYESVQGYEGAAIGALVTGGVLVGSGAALLTATYLRERRERLTLVPGPGAVGLALRMELP